MANGILDGIILGKTALWELYDGKSLLSTFQKIVPMDDAGNLQVELIPSELASIPSGNYRQAITLKNPDGTLRTFRPEGVVNMKREDEPETEEEYNAKKSELP